MNRNSVKVMIYSYFLNLKSYINTYISATYTESIVSNIKPQGNHNYMVVYYLSNGLLVILNRKVITTDLPSFEQMTRLLVILNRKVITTKLNDVITALPLLEALNRKVITTL